MRSEGNTDNVWIHCEGRNAADKEALGDIEYYPRSRGIPIEFFPFMGRPYGYHSPLVAIKIHPRKEFLGQLLHVECRAYFRDVVHNTKNKMGLVQFEVLINE